MSKKRKIKIHKIKIRNIFNFFSLFKKFINKGNVKFIILAKYFSMLTRKIN